MRKIQSKIQWNVLHASKYSFQVMQIGILLPIVRASCMTLTLEMSAFIVTLS